MAGPTRLRNGGFEEVAQGQRFAAHWTGHNWGPAASQFSARLDRANVHGGEAAIVVRGFGEGTRPGAFTSLTVHPGTYELRFFAAADVGATARVGAHVAGVDVPERTVGEDWTLVKHTVVVREKKLGASLRLFTSTGNVRVWFDDVMLERVK